MTDWGLMALSAQIGYIMPLKSMLQLKSEINVKVDNVMCWKHTIKNSSIFKPFDKKDITRVVFLANHFANVLVRSSVRM